MKKRILAMILCVLTVVGIMPVFNIGTSALESTGNAKMDAFINDYRFTNGASWGDRRPYLSSWGSLQCCAYVADFVYYCFGKSGPKTGTNFKSAWDIRAGDVINVGGENGNGHWFAVLKRDGNRLYVAEGNWAKKVRIGWNYTITGSRTISGTNYSFSNGWHYLDSTPIAYTLDVNTVVDGVAYNSGYSGVSFDVRLNNKVVSDNVGDYCASNNSGTEWAVIDIKIPSAYVLSGKLDYYGNYAGTLNGNTDVNLTLVTPKLVASATLNGNKYEFYKAKTPWIDAEAYAEAKGGHLATVTTQAEQDFIKKNNTLDMCWLGGTDRDKEGEWKWITGENFGYSNWASGEPNNSKGACGEGEKFLCIYGAGEWNDTCYYTDSIAGFIVEYEHTHKWDSGVTVKNATCTVNGQKKYTCTLCKSTKTETLKATGHSYTETKVAASCTKDAYLSYKCSWCGNTYTKEITGSYVYSDWTNTKPSVSGNTVVESKKQYRYRTAVQSYTGWTVSGTGTHIYFSRPSGMKSSAYSSYASSSIGGYENELSKRVVGSAVHNSYIYWHWASPTCYGVAGNCFIGEYEGEPGRGTYKPYTVWETFESASDLTEAVSGICSRVQGHSKYSYWWFKAETFKQTYTDYVRQKQSSWSSWSSWQDGSVTATGTKQVETCTLYRTKTPVTGQSALGHKWDSGKITKAPTCTVKGVKTYKCTRTGCTATKTESVAVLGHKWNSGTVTKAPTCTVKGVKTYKCTRTGCTATKTEAVAVLGHKWGEPTVVKDATEKADGVRVYACMNCTATKNETFKYVKVLKGDINGDKKVNTKDARLILRYAAKLEKFTLEQEKAADVNSDTKINTKDARKILRVVAKLETM